MDVARIIHSLRQLRSFLLEQNSPHHYRVCFFGKYFPLKQVFTREGFHFLSYFVFSLFSFQLSPVTREEEEKKKKRFVGEFFHVFWLHACLGGEFRSGEGCWLLSEVSWDLLVNAFWTRDCGWGRSFASLHLCLYQVQSPVAPPPYPQQFSQCLAFFSCFPLVFFLGCRC